MSLTPFVKEWHPERFALGAALGESQFIVIISNQPLDNKRLLLELCERALYVVCADGGANQWKDLALTELEEQICGLDLICGDLDSVRPDVLNYYKEKHVNIIQDNDQYSTDLMKCLKYIEKGEGLPIASNSNRHRLPNLQGEQTDVAIFGGLGGRADQAFSQLHHLYTMANHGVSGWKRDVFLITPESLVLLLEKGHNKICTSCKVFTENVGIIPIGRPSIISTHGLEWDVKDWNTEFGGQISTSNHIKEGVDFVDVTSTERVLFTLEFASPGNAEPDPPLTDASDR